MIIWLYERRLRSARSSLRAGMFVADDEDARQVGIVAASAAEGLVYVL